MSAKIARHRGDQRDFCHIGDGLRDLGRYQLRDFQRPGAVSIGRGGEHRQDRASVTQVTQAQRCRRRGHGQPVGERRHDVQNTLETVPIGIRLDHDTQFHTGADTIP